MTKLGWYAALTFAGTLLGAGLVREGIVEFFAGLALAAR